MAAWVDCSLATRDAVPRPPYRLPELDSIVKKLPIEEV